VRGWQEWRRLLILCSGCMGCAQMCGLESGFLQAEPDAGVADAASGFPYVPSSAVSSLAPSDASAADGGTAVVADDCKVYCDLMKAACTGENLQYLTLGNEVCPALCPFFSAEDLRCRIEIIRGANSEDDKAECSAAGPSGWSEDEGTRCGPSLCANYCTLMLRQCPNTVLMDEDQNVVPSEQQACISMCEGIPKDPEYGNSYSTAMGRIRTSGQHTGPYGNNVQCRILHIGNAAGAGPSRNPAMDSGHCQHAAGREGYCIDGYVPPP
jgi:hypothetical protein